jgi:hypothetical protein
LGGGAGGGLVGASGNLAENIESLAQSGDYKYDSESKKFGEPGLGGAQVIKTPDPEATATEFFDKLTVGADLDSVGEGTLATFQGESFAYLRLQSKSGGPAVNINLNVGGKGTDYKIHFIKIDTSIESSSK